MFENLAVFPLFGGNGCDIGYRLLDDALGDESASVTEVSESGRVPELAFENRGTDPVLLLDGEELVGAKQNRVLNLTILAPANATITIPVTCVEAGRWAWKSRKFSSAGRAQYAGLRSRKMIQVSASMSEDGAARSDQDDMWDEIVVKMRRMDAPSGTAAMADIYERYRAPLESYVGAFTAAKDQAGAVFAVNGEVRGLELFDRPETFGRQLKKLLQSWGLDAIDFPDGNGKAADAAAAADLIRQAAGLEGRAYPATGLGTDLRLEGGDLSGAALVVGSRVVHLCAFRVDENKLRH